MLGLGLGLLGLGLGCNEESPEPIKLVESNELVALAETDAVGSKSMLEEMSAELVPGATISMLDVVTSIGVDIKRLLSKADEAVVSV